MSKIHLGVLGLSKGNGHPYSWAAICNGYNKKYMKECPFPVIPQYLCVEHYPESFIDNAEVTHIWTQDMEISEHIANASCIKHVVKDYTEMIGKVDAILLARDDAENHYEMCRPFLEAGLMVYIDKPLAFTVKEAKQIFALEKFEGQIFSCSAMRFAREIEEKREQIKSLGEISYIDATTMKFWDRYSAHIIDPVLRIVGDEVAIANVSKLKNANTTGMVVTLSNGLIVSLKAHTKSPIPISIKLVGENGELDIVFRDTFFAFRGALRAFIESVEQKKSVISKSHMMKLVDWVERGR